MVTFIPHLRHSQINQILRVLATGQCCAIYGLSNTGKSLLLRGLAQPAQQAAYAQLTGGAGTLVYIDCNRVVELSATGFYEIVVRSLLETLESTSAAALLNALRDQHNRITTAASPFQASLAFNNALSEVCRQLGHSLVLLFDEFDEVYAALESRTLLNLRAIKDNSQNQLMYLTATLRPLVENRPPGDDEFAELFSAATFPLGLLTPTDVALAAQQWGGAALTPPLLAEITRLSGGHLGLVSALAQATARNPETLSADPNARAECLKIWHQLHSEEQAALITLVTESEAGILPQPRTQLLAFGLLSATDQIFSELFATFVRRQSAAPTATTPGVTVDEDAGEVWVDGTRVMALTDLEYRLMRLLAERRDRLTTKDMIVERVWGGDYLDRVDDARIEKLVSRLRAKIEPDPTRPRYLLTQRGRGYKLAGQPADGKADDDV